MLFAFLIRSELLHDQLGAIFALVLDSDFLIKAVRVHRIRSPVVLIMCVNRYVFPQGTYVLIILRLKSDMQMGRTPDQPRIRTVEPPAFLPGKRAIRMQGAASRSACRIKPGRPGEERQLGLVNTIPDRGVLPGISCLFVAKQNIDTSGGCAFFLSLHTCAGTGLALQGHEHKNITKRKCRSYDVIKSENSNISLIAKNGIPSS